MTKKLTDEQKAARAEARRQAKLRKAERDELIRYANSGEI